MDIDIIYNPEDQGVLVTSNFAEIQKRMDQGTDPKVNYEKISGTDFNRFPINSIGFDRVDNACFQHLKEFFSTCELEAIAFHNTIADLTDVALNVKHLILGNNSKINLSEENFENLKEITFLSVKTFKGKFLDKIHSVEKLVLWYESKKANELLPWFPNLNELHIFNGSLEALNLSNNQLVGTLQLHNCTKLQMAVLSPPHHFTKVIVERCKKMDISNLGSSVVKF